MDVKISSGLTYLQSWLNLSDIEHPHHTCQFYNDNKTEQKKSVINISNRNKRSSKKQFSNFKFNTKMSPISEKRLPPLSKDNVKENIAGTRMLYEKTYSKGPEILDFRDTWLQEIETYKDHIKGQQLLTQHNHVHTADGCFRDMPKESIRNIEPIKRRIRTRSDSDPQDNSKGLTRRDQDDELVLKRAREESYSPNNNSSHQQIHQNSHRNILNGKNSSPPPSTPKIIINPYHASLLNTTTTQLEKNKTNFSTTKYLPSTNGSVNLNGNKKRHQPKPKSPPRVTDIGTENILLDPQLPLELPQVEVLSTEMTPTILNVITSETPDEITKPISSRNNENGQSDDKSEDDGSKFDDDEDDFGDIDNDELYEPSSDSDDEYSGQVYLLDCDEELDNPAEETNTNTNNITLNTTEYITPKSPFTPSLFPLVPPYLTFSSHVEKGPAVHSDLQKILKWKYSNIMPRIVKKVITNSGFRLVKKKENINENIDKGSAEKDLVEELDEEEANDWMGTWEKHMKSPCFKTIRSHQKYNHLPGTFKIGRKDSVWRNLRGFMTKHGKREFGFMQKTYILPQELEMLKRTWPKHAKKCTKWIIKPPASARGSGIQVVSRWSEIPKQKPLVVQKYIEKPLLINGNKFDLRLYVIVTSINPLRIFMHTDGLARFASVQYSDKLDTLGDRCMHLTNYSINKLSANYSKNEDINACQGHKWTLKSLWSYFRQRGINTKRLWGTLRSLVIKTVLSGESCLNRMFKTNVNSKYSCYELFGFDVLLDENLVPWLLEVNISPSLHSELPLDLHVKGPLIQAVLNTALYQVPPKLSEEQQNQITDEYKLKGPLCYDRRLYTTYLSPEEIKKHNQYTNKSIEFREDYLDTILDYLTPDDLRCLIIAEDELARSSPLERIFPTSESHVFLQFIEGPRYYNRLLDAWETKYGKDREEGRALLKKECANGRHLEVPPAALKRELSEKEIGENMGSGNVDDSKKLSNTSIAADNDDTSNPDNINNSNNTLRVNSCSKEVTIPQKQLNSEVYRSPQPIIVEIK